MKGDTMLRSARPSHYLSTETGQLHLWTSGVKAYLRKPFRPSELVHTVKRLLGE